MVSALFHAWFLTVKGRYDLRIDMQNVKEKLVKNQENQYKKIYQVQSVYIKYKYMDLVWVVEYLLNIACF